MAARERKEHREKVFISLRLFVFFAFFCGYSGWRRRSGEFAILVGLVLAATGCTTKSNARLNAQSAYLAGQNATLQQQLAQMPANFPAVTIIGPVQNPRVPWVVGLTLAQAIATASYQAPTDPTSITITRQGEAATIDPNVLLNGTVITLQAGDVVEIH